MNEAQLSRGSTLKGHLWRLDHAIAHINNAKKLSTLPQEEYEKLPKTHNSQLPLALNTSRTPGELVGMAFSELMEQEHDVISSKPCDWTHLEVMDALGKLLVKMKNDKIQEFADL